MSPGVPQGSYCGLNLFNLFINDFGEGLQHCNYLFFGDIIKFLWLDDDDDVLYACTKFKVNVVSIAFQD